jgi:hypothetical protein
VTRKEVAGPAVTHVELDHLAYITDRTYRRRIHLQLRRLAQRPGVFIEDVWHEPDNECCAVEPWSQTAERIVKALNMDGLPTLGVRVEL